MAGNCDCGTGPVDAVDGNCPHCGRPVAGILTPEEIDALLTAVDKDCETVDVSLDGNAGPCGAGEDPMEMEQGVMLHGEFKPAQMMSREMSSEHIYRALLSLAELEAELGDDAERAKELKSRLEGIFESVEIYGFDLKFCISNQIGRLNREFDLGPAADNSRKMVKMKPFHCARGRGCAKCDELAAEGEKYCLIELWPDPPGMARPLIDLKTSEGKHINAEFWIERVFDTDEEAMAYAKENLVEVAERELNPPQPFEQPLPTEFGESLGPLDKGIPDLTGQAQACSKCRKTITYGVEVCPHCGAEFK